MNDTRKTFLFTSYVMLSRAVSSFLVEVLLLTLKTFHLHDLWTFINMGEFLACIVIFISAQMIIYHAYDLGLPVNYKVLLSTPMPNSFLYQILLFLRTSRTLATTQPALIDCVRDKRDFL